MTHSDMERPLEREGRELMRQLLQGHLDQCTHALRASGDRDEYWHYHEAKEHDRNHTAKYASGDVPPLTAIETNETCCESYRDASAPHRQMKATFTARRTPAPVYPMEPHPAEFWQGPRVFSVLSPFLRSSV